MVDHKNVLLQLLCSSLFLFFYSSQLRFTSGFTNVTDRQALLAIKDQILEDPFKVLSSWNNSLHFCDWQGVTCSRRHQRVAFLNLSSKKLAGSLSPHIGNLTFLRAIVVKNNSFHGTIPREVGQLFRLQNLSLASNSFGGELPTSLSNCSNIRFINVLQNNLGGEIPAELGSLSKLLVLSLRQNYFRGTIPPSFGNLSALHRLSLFTNHLEGSIPTELFQLSNLQLLNLADNNLSGVVPASLHNFSNIMYISVAVNKLQGSLPPTLGLSLPKLRIMFTAFNQFSGLIPPSIANASELAKLDIGKNSLTGSVPMNLGSLQNLEIFDVADNLLGSNEVNDLSFLTSLSNCSNLSQLYISDNQFRGVFPNSIANLSTKLIALGLGQNYIYGNIPLEIGNLINLKYLALHESMLTGSIPNSIGKLSNLQQFYLFNNNISGKIPSSIGNFTRLADLLLHINMLEGSIPVSLGNCRSLQLLELSENCLTGAIPNQVVGLPSLTIGLSLSNNFLSGQLPPQVGDIQNLGMLDVSENELSGEIPSTLGNCLVLEFLYMEGNHFEGTIPSSFKQLKGIQVLDLSRNNLSGQIPRFLGEFSSIQNLNLSYNMFDGEVPIEGVFKNISAFSVVGNNKLCGGIEALLLPQCLAEVSETSKMPFNHRVITLVIALPIVLLLVCLSALLFRTRRSRQQTSSGSLVQSQYPKLSYAELHQATNGFSSANLIGKGRYGSVYKGILNSAQQIVAVKVLNLQERGANKSFFVECEALRNIRHRNLVKIVTSCSSNDFRRNDFKALVFEYMSNGSLEDWLQPIFSERHDQKNLNLARRINIAIDIASALDYLHHHCETTISHCDIKPSNVLLDDDFCAHVGDFGLARLLMASTAQPSHAQSTSTGIRGTVGYVAPEYGMGGEISTQGDVYSYGILLLEMFTGKRPTNSMFTDNFSLHNCAKIALPGQVMEVVDPLLILEEKDESNRVERGSKSNIAKIEACIASLLRVGVLCSAELPSDRMDVRDVLKELHGIKKVLVEDKSRA